MNFDEDALEADIEALTEIKRAVIKNLRDVEANLAAACLTLSQIRVNKNQNLGPVA